MMKRLAPVVAAAALGASLALAGGNAAAQTKTLRFVAHADVKIIETRTGGCVWRRGPRQSGVRADGDHDQDRRACENLSNGMLRRRRRIRLRVRARRWAREKRGGATMDQVCFALPRDLRQD